MVPFGIIFEALILVLKVMCYCIDWQRSGLGTTTGEGGEAGGGHN